MLQFSRSLRLNIQVRGFCLVSCFLKPEQSHTHILTYIYNIYIYNILYISHYITHSLGFMLGEERCYFEYTFYSCPSLALGNGSIHV